jgi:hypothetical protein
VTSRARVHVRCMCASPRAAWTADDAMRYGALPIFVSGRIFSVGIPFGCWVPWRLMTLHVHERPFLHDAAAALANATRALSPGAEARMRELVMHFGRDVLWRHPASRVAENILLSAARRRGAQLDGCCPLKDELEN